MLVIVGYCWLYCVMLVMVVSDSSADAYVGCCYALVFSGPVIVDLGCLVTLPLICICNQAST